MFRFPFTNFHELNLDWILSIVKKFSDLVEPMQSAVEDVNQAVETAQTALETATTASENAAQATEDAGNALELVEQAIIGVVPDNSVSTSKLRDEAVTTPKIADGSVNTNKIANGAVTVAKITDKAVTTPKIADEAVTAAKIADEAVTPNKLSPATKKLIVPLWRGKHCLIIGDSWTYGWNGSEVVDTKWTDVFLSVTGMTADIIGQSQGGFTTKGSGSYTNENFIDVLEHVKTSSYDAIIVQGGVNDIVYSTDNIKNAMTSFKTVCNTYWPGVPVYLNITTPCFYLGTTQNARAISMINDAIDLGYFVNPDNELISLSSPSAKGTDTAHLSKTGYSLLGHVIAGFVTGSQQNHVLSQMAYPENNYILPDFSVNADVGNSNDFGIKVCGNRVNIFMNLNITTDSLGFLNAVTGLPLAELDFVGLGMVLNRTDNVAASVEAFISNGTLVLGCYTGQSLRGKTLLISAQYTTKSV